MCGINGIVSSVGTEEAADRIGEMNRALAHRGPDSNGIWVSDQGRVAFGHVRLSILDLSETGNQPMVLEDGSLAMVFNGEVYNFQALRSELSSLGHRFRGHSDSEVVLHAFAQWGTECLRRFNGMYAVAFADRRSAKVYVARDRLGIKPLHYSLADGNLTFSSEIKGLFASGLLAPRPDFSRIAEFMYYGVTLGESTLLNGVRRLPPGSYAEYDLRTGRFEITRYWRVDELVPGASHQPVRAGLVDEVRRRLDDAIQSHLISDVPVGVFLSGGIDSSAIVALGSRHYSGRLRTYSVGFDYVGDADELSKARLVAERFGTEHNEIRVSGTDLKDLLRRLIVAHDLPFSDAANIPLYQLCQAMGGSTKVVLQGDGGDEVFGGYRRYELLDLIKVLNPLARLVRPLLNGDSLTKQLQPLRRIASALAERDGAKRMALLLTTEEEVHSPIRVLSSELRALAATQDPFVRYRECGNRFAKQDPVQQMLLTDLEIILPDIFLEKVDRSTMARSVEVRVPFLDNDLVEFAVSLPASVKVRYGRKKSVLRAALRGIVPDEILDAPKTGFGVPFGRWMRGALGDHLREVALDPSSRAASLFDTSILAKALDEHRSGRRDCGFLLWKCLQLALWSEFVLHPSHRG